MKATGPRRNGWTRRRSASLTLRREPFSTRYGRGGSATFPFRLRLIFGMGVEAVQLGDDSRSAYFDSDDPDIIVDPAKGSAGRRRCFRCLQPLAEALAAVREVTDDYQLACPDEFVIDPAGR